MSNTKKSLDILEEQMFKILKEYVPQTGRGFSDGSEYIGMNTKGPYERTEIEKDKPWYKKKYKEDSKNLKILIGHGSKKLKHVKTGSPFTEDPPKRRPVNKLSAPPMALEEIALPQNFKDEFLKLTNAQINFKAKKDIKDGSLTAFKKDEVYNATIEGDKITTETALFFDKTLTKKEFLEKLEASSDELCNNLYCDVSVITVNGKTLTFNEFLKASTQPTPSEKPKEEPEKKEIKINDDAELVGTFSGKIADGVRVDKAIKQTIGYNPVARKFAKTFYDTAREAILKLKNPDERKAAALVTLLFGEVASVPVELTAGIATSIDPKIFKGIDGFFEEIKNNVLAPLMAPIEELKKLYSDLKETVKKTKEFMGGLTGSYLLRDLPNAEGNKNGIVILGDQQKTNLKEAFESFFNLKNYNFIKSFDFEKNTPATQIAGSPDLKKFIQDNKDKIAIIFISLGSTNPINSTGEANQLVGFLKNLSDARIVWVGSPPYQISGAIDAKLELKNASLNAANLAIEAASHNPMQRFYFINPMSYLDAKDASIFLDKETLNLFGAKKVLDGTLGNVNKEEKKEEKKKEEKKEEKKNEPKPITFDPSDLINSYEFISGVGSLTKFALLDDDFKKELIKLSKRAKIEYGQDAKIHIQSGIRTPESSHNHASKKAADIRISVNGENLSAQETYALIIKAIVDGQIKDGAVGYYANNKGIYDPDSMDVSTEYPHYDLRHNSKWFWFKCEKDIAACRKRVNSPNFKKQNYSKNATPLDYQTSGDISAKDIAGPSNPLSLPKDVTKFFNTSSGVIAKNEDSKELTQPQILNNQQIIEKYKLNPSEDFKKNRYQIRENFGGFNGYIKGLWQNFEANKNELNSWTPSKIRQVIEKYADKHGVKRYIVIGTILGESSFIPTGIYSQSINSKGSPNSAIKLNSTAYGVGGVTSETYDTIKEKMSNKVPHYMLWNPEYAIEASVLTLKFNLDQFDNNLEKALMTYAGKKFTGEKKIKDVFMTKIKYGDK